jgi:hypothetical protein
MTGFVFEGASELILFGLLPLLVTVATVWIIWHVLEKINPDEVTDIGSFLTFIIAVVPFVMLICGGLTILIYDEMKAASGGLRSLPLVSFSREIFAGAVIYIGLAVWLWSHWRKLRIRQKGILRRGAKDRGKHCEAAGVIRTPSDVGSAMKTGGLTDIVDALPQGGAHE